jgi:AcrR family transcriptional regulator
MASSTRKQRKRDQSSQEILVAARTLFLRDGHAKFSMRKLAKELGCVPGTIYLYFKDKDALIAQLVEESFEHLMDDLEASQTGKDPLKDLEHMMGAYVTFGLEHPNDYRFAFMLHRTKGLERERPRPHRSYAMLRRLVGACIEGGLFRPVELEIATQGVWSGIHGVTSLMITMPNFPWGDKQAVVDHAIHSIIAGLRLDSRLGE